MDILKDILKIYHHYLGKNLSFPFYTNYFQETGTKTSENLQIYWKS